jgi:hypothetical protein
MEKRNLRHNTKIDVILYLNTWASILEEELIDFINDVFDFEKIQNESKKMRKTRRALVYLKDDLVRAKANIKRIEFSIKKMESLLKGE